MQESFDTTLAKLPPRPVVLAVAAATDLDPRTVRLYWRTGRCQLRVIQRIEAALIEKGLDQYRVARVVLPAHRLGELMAST